MEWTKEEFFYLVKYLHLGLCQDPKYSKLPFSERDKFIVNLVHRTQHIVADARKASRAYKGFKEQADPYFSKETLGKKGLFVFVQYSQVWMREQPEYKDKSPNELDKIIAGWVRRSESTIRAASIGGGYYKQLRGCVDKRNARRKQGNAEKTFDRIQKSFLEHLRDEEFAKLPRYEQAKIVGKDTEDKPSTVWAVVYGCGTYEIYGDLYHKRDLNERVIGDYNKRLQDQNFAKLVQHEKFRVIARFHKLSSRKVKHILYTVISKKSENLDDVLTAEN